jgi:hypothetical protein
VSIFLYRLGQGIGRHRGMVVGIWLLTLDVADGRRPGHRRGDRGSLTGIGLPPPIDLAAFASATYSEQVSLGRRSAEPRVREA